MNKLLGVIGWSGSGKTTLLEFVIAAMAARGQKVHLIKHSHHDVKLEPPHKDSARLRRAGAGEVLLASPYRLAWVRELRDEAEPTLAELAQMLSPAELVLVEGYKWEAIPKLEVFRPSHGQPPLYPDDLHIAAVASDVPRPPDARADLDWLDLNMPANVIAWIDQKILSA
jgi:molybdopterin-guanine dinucleotide biosynthesis protein B